MGQEKRPFIFNGKRERLHLRERQGMNGGINGRYHSTSLKMATEKECPSPPWKNRYTVLYCARSAFIRDLGVVTASSVTYIPPVVALLIGYVLIGEPIDLSDIIATCFIFADVFLLKTN